jgi:nitrite reductase/ring-hydroxylating ferredoxin subunit
MSATRPRTRRRLAFGADELPSGGRKVITSGRREIVVINTDGALYAVFNRCPHQQAPLDRGPLGGATMPIEGGPVGAFEFCMEGRVLRCPWHHFEFDLETGRCLADPRRFRVATYEVRQEGEEIAVYV